MFAPRVYMKGMISPAVIKSIKGIENSGIWDFHVEVTKTRPYFSSSPPRPSQATMWGNVIVIFLLLPVGCFFAVIVFTLEHFNKKYVTPTFTSPRRMKGTTVYTQVVSRRLWVQYIYLLLNWFSITYNNRILFLEIYSY